MNRVAAEFPLSNTQFQFWRIPFSNTARDAAGKLGSIQQRDRQEMQWRYKPVLSEYSRNSGRCTEPVTLLRCEQEKRREEGVINVISDAIRYWRVQVRENAKQRESRGEATFRSPPEDVCTKHYIVQGFLGGPDVLRPILGTHYSSSNRNRSEHPSPPSGRGCDGTLHWRKSAWW